MYGGFCLFWQVSIKFDFHPQILIRALSWKKNSGGFEDLLPVIKHIGRGFRSSMNFVSNKGISRASRLKWPLIYGNSPTARALYSGVSWPPNLKIYNISSFISSNTRITKVSWLDLLHYDTARTKKITKNKRTVWQYCVIMVHKQSFFLVLSQPWLCLPGFVQNFLFFLTIKFSNIMLMWRRFDIG